MGISRRQFLLSIPAYGAGFILPAFFDRATAVLARTGAPLIIPPRRVTTTLYAEGERGGNYDLYSGDPDAQPPDLTWREYIEQYCVDEESFWADTGLGEGDINLDDWADQETVLDSWYPQESPTVLAYRELEALDLGPDLDAPSAVGEIVFIEGCCPGNEYVGVHAVGELSLSLLQERLNQLNTGILIELA